jgi:hypothetical protein
MAGPAVEISPRAMRDLRRLEDRGDTVVVLRIVDRKEFDRALRAL